MRLEFPRKLIIIFVAECLWIKNVPTIKTVHWPSFLKDFTISASPTSCSMEQCLIVPDLLATDNGLCIQKRSYLFRKIGRINDKKLNI